MTMQIGGNYVDQLIGELNTKTLLTKAMTKKNKLIEAEMLDDLELTGTSLNLFSQDNAFRIYLYKLVNGTHKNFERFIIFFVAISSV